MKYYGGLVLMMIALWCAQPALAQGCSDAGVCTVPGIQAAGLGRERSNTLALSLTQGAGERDVAVTNVFVTYQRELSRRFSASAKLGFAATDGELGNATGLSDLYLNGIYLVKPDGAWKAAAIAGIKVPLSSSDHDQDGISLPMAYQPSLGTRDLIVGTRLDYGHYGLSAALQIPLDNPNDNSFPSSSLLERQSDLVIRADAKLELADDKFYFIPGLLPIIHIGNDAYNIHSTGSRIVIENSAGLTLNLSLAATYQIREQHALKFSLGFPLMTRDARPDGLTREYVAGIEFEVGF